MPRKSKTKDIPQHLLHHKEALKAISWCFKRYIKAYPVPCGTQYHIIVEDGLKRFKSPKTYNKDEWSDVIWGIYLHYYRKNANSL